MLLPVLPQLKHRPVCNVDLAAVIITIIINIIIIWTLGVVLNPGTRSGSRGEAVIKTISFNSAAGRSQETGHATCGML